MSTPLPDACPTCEALTVDNAPHCAARSERWSKACQWMRCATCGTVYAAAGFYRPVPTRPTV